MDRREEIIKAVDNLLRVHDEWEADDSAPVLPTAELEMALTDAVAIGENGDIPGSCRDVCTALARLGLEWEAYANGSRLPDLRPRPSFWGAFRALIKTREQAEPTEPKQPEPVFMLLEQKVPHHQIAHHIWGYRGVGPFVMSNGQIDSNKIAEEGREPGKHTKGWVHPEQIERDRERQRDYSRRTSALVRREDPESRETEKASIVEMLREGQYADVIARVKRVSLDEVLSEAKRYSITPQQRPNLAAERAPQEPEMLAPHAPGGVMTTALLDNATPGDDLPSVDDWADSGDADPDGDESDGESSNSETGSSSNAASSDSSAPPPNAAAIIAELASEGRLGVAEIVAACKARNCNVTFAQVKAGLKAARQAANV